MLLLAGAIEDLSRILRSEFDCDWTWGRGDRVSERGTSTTEETVDFRTTVTGFVSNEKFCSSREREDGSGIASINGLVSSALGTIEEESSDLVGVSI